MKTKLDIMKAEQTCTGFVQNAFTKNGKRYVDVLVGEQKTNALVPDFILQTPQELEEVVLWRAYMENPRFLAFPSEDLIQHMYNHNRQISQDLGLFS